MYALVEHMYLIMMSIVITQWRIWTSGCVCIVVSSFL